LTGAKLTNANLTNANLEWITLRRADLTKANLTGANLRSADLTDADLTGVIGGDFSRVISTQRGSQRVDTYSGSEGNIMGEAGPELALDEVHGMVWVRGRRLNTLSKEEYAILLCLVQNGNRTVSRNELAAVAWPENLDGIPSSEIARCIRRLRRQIDKTPPNPSKTILTRRGNGYIVPFTYESVEINEVIRTEFGLKNLLIDFTQDKRVSPNNADHVPQHTRTIGEVWAKGEKLSPLSVTEYNILEFLVLNRGRTVSYAEILNEVWVGYGYVGASTIDQAVQGLRRKIEDNPLRPEVIIRRFGYGYTIPVRGQVKINDEGPGSIETAVIAGWSGAKETFVGVVQLIRFIFWACIAAIIIAIVIVLYILLLIAPAGYD
jgi:DNA-binding response OmpR family regulator